MLSKFYWPVIAFCVLPVISAAQDFLYKSNGEKVAAEVLLKSRHELTYRLADKKDSVLYHISTAFLDSVIFHDGTKELYILQRLKNPIPEEVPKTYGTNLIGFDAGGFFLKERRTFSLSYEHLLLDHHLGIKAQWGKDLKESWYWDDDLNLSGQKKGQFIRMGLNWYIFDPGTFRIITGLHFISSSYNVHIEKVYHEQNPPYESHTEYIKDKKNYNFLVISAGVFYQIIRNLAINAVIDFSAKGPEDTGKIFRSEILINF